MKTYLFLILVLLGNVSLAQTPGDVAHHYTLRSESSGLTAVVLEFKDARQIMLLDSTNSFANLSTGELLNTLSFGSGFVAGQNYFLSNRQSGWTAVDKSFDNLPVRAYKFSIDLLDSRNANIEIRAGEMAMTLDLYDCTEPSDHDPSHTGTDKAQMTSAYGCTKFKRAY